MNEITDIITEARESPLLFPPHEDTAKRQLSVNQEAGPHQTLNPLVP